MAIVLSRFKSHLIILCGLALSVIAVPPAVGADLDNNTAQAYEGRLAVVNQGFARQTDSEAFLQQATPEALARMRRGEILLTAGTGDGITDVPKGLFHHWRAAAFVPDVTLDRLLAIVQDYTTYSDVYDWVIVSQLAGRDGDRFRTFFRVKRSAGVVTGVVDTWLVTEYRRLGPDRAIAVAKADCIRQVEHAGESSEYRLRPGTGSGYLWRADALSKYLERDGGVYVELDTIGLSRGYPPLLGWIIEPIARRLGRESAAASLSQLRAAVISAPVPRGERARVTSGAAWCGE